ncbi:MAG: phosphoenolpyruvate carboxylase [Candidatus Bathyarchaeota archaeon]|nr:phosphoenolpyruvate carboxylase [Candidatus Bathyarchaeota archaeon]
MSDEYERKIPRTMSTQHPDNVNVPEWSKEDVIDGLAEVFEAYYAYDTLGCQEVMWDSEGKDVDTRVLRKLFDKHWNYFKDNAIGKNLFLTYRIPNPRIEAVEKKVVVETLQNIPIAYDAATSFYKNEAVPIFEVILPFTTDGKEPVWLYNYYKGAIVSDEDLMLDENTKASDWIGATKPKSINVIPLVEDYNSMLTVDKIITPYIKAVKPKNLRFFIARSDPALNYGSICAVLLSKIALSKLRETQEATGVAIHPIIGAGSKPFRGHLAPDNVENFLCEYKGLATATIQSAARYDYPLKDVQRFIERLNKELPYGEASLIDDAEEAVLLEVLVKCRKQYERVAEVLAPFVNSIAPYVPQRRARKLHIGLFGYSRNVAGTTLPRAITFAAILYSIGVPPEFIGTQVLEDLKDKELQTIKKHYVNLKHDYNTIGGYVSWENINMLMEMHRKIAKRANMDVDKLRLALTRILADLKSAEDTLNIKVGPQTLAQRKHENFTNNFLISYMEHEDNEAKKALTEAAKLRRCLG